MKKYFKFIPIISLLLVSLFFITPTYAANAPGTDGSSPTPESDSSKGSSDGSDCRNFLGLTSWDCGVNITDTDSLKTGIWQIAANVSIDITVIAAYLIIGYVIYGGYLYTMSGGDTNKVSAGKKTLLHGFIGLAIVMSANVIMSTIRFILLSDRRKLDCDILNEGCISEPTGLIDRTIGWVIGVVGVVSAVFVVFGGIQYLTSAGEPEKLRKAKQTITYALIGLAITALATTITAFVTNMIREANKNAFHTNHNTYISKEVHETNA